jgi:hypothetical protein
MKIQLGFLRRPLVAAGLTTALAAGIVSGLGGQPAGASGLTIIITPIIKVLPTTTTVAASTASTTQGTSVTLTATVKTLNLGGLLITPASNVVFSASNGGAPVALGSGGLTPGCLVLVSSCTASVTTSSLPVGNDLIAATYTGDSLSQGSSGTTSVTVLSNVPPTAPALSASAVSGKVTLNWSAPTSSSPITGYTVYKSTTAGAQGAALTTVSASTLTLVDTAVTNGTTYYYEVAASNAAGFGAASAQASATPVALTPAAPTNLVATSQVGDILLTWNAPATSDDPITSYDVYRGTTTGGEGVTPLVTNVPSPSYQDTTTVIGTPYFYVVTAISAAGPSPASNEATATASAPPAPPTGSSSGTETCTTACPPISVTGSDDTTDQTDVTVVPGSNTPQTVTVSLSDTNLHGCGSAPGGGGGEFAVVNSTNDPDGTEIQYRLTGAEALAARNFYFNSTNNGPGNFGSVGCLGLGTDWNTSGAAGPPNAVFNTQDGLWEGTPIECVNDGANQLTGPSTALPFGTFSNPCTEVIDGTGLSTGQFFEIDYLLPPGDGKVGH